MSTWFRPRLDIACIQKSRLTKPSSNVEWRYCQDFLSLTRKVERPFPDPCFWYFYLVLLAPITSLLGLIITTKLPLCVPFSRTAKDISSSTVDNKHVIYLPRLILSCHSCHLDRSGVPKIVELLIWIHMKTRGNRGDEKSRPSQDGLGVCCCDERVRFPDEPERARHWRLC